MSWQPMAYLLTYFLPFLLLGTMNLPRLYPYLGVHHQVTSFPDTQVQAFEYGYGHLICLGNGLAHLKLLSPLYCHSGYLPLSFFFCLTPLSCQPFGWLSFFLSC